MNEIMTSSILPSQKRIESIDALRAFTLLGIFLVHLAGGFNIPYITSEYTWLDAHLINWIRKLLSARCATTFSMLFGVSFYFILKNPNNSSLKFAWRCVLLMCIGFVNKFFFTGDVLMVYGFCGIIMLCCRKFNPIALFGTALGLYVLSSYLYCFQLGNMLMGDCSLHRFYEGASFVNLLDSYLSTIPWAINHFLNVNLGFVLANFLLGYMVSKQGFIEKMDEKLSWIHVTVVICIYIISYLFCIHYVKNWDIMFVEKLCFSFMHLCGAVCYSLIIIILYNFFAKHGFSKILHSFECYGKCGLTNYSCQGVFACVILVLHGVAFRGEAWMNLLLYSLVFYLFQLFFSVIWLHFFKNGPMEYLWRCATEMKWLPLRKKM